MAHKFEIYKDKAGEFRVRFGSLDLAFGIAQRTGAVGQHVAGRQAGGAGRVAAGPLEAKTVGGVLDQERVEDRRSKSGRGHPGRVSGLFSDINTDSGKFPSRNSFRKMPD